MVTCGNPTEAAPANLDAKVIAAHCAEMAKKYESIKSHYFEPAAAFFGPLRPKDLPTTVIKGEISRAADAITAAGAQTHLFRPPGGSYSPEVIDLAKELGMRVVLWSVDPQDWRNGITAKQIVKTVLSNVRPGSIVLMHDGGGHQSATIRALPKIIRGIRKKHLKLVTIT